MIDIKWKIQDLLSEMSDNSILQANHQIIKGMTLDSRAVQPGDMFFAIKGTVSDGHDFIEQAIAKGATAIVLEDLPRQLHPEVAYIRHRDVVGQMASLAKKFFDNPANKLKLIGITGTNGKTTTARLLYQTWRAMGYPAGVISTIDVRMGDRIIPTTLTTPDLITLNRWLYEMVEYGIEWVAMEVSSHAIEQGRVREIPFTGGIFTNISHDHLDYHGDMKHYIQAKKKFFDGLPASAFALANIDDPRGKIMLQNTRAKKAFYALAQPASFKGKIISMEIGGMELEFNGVRFVTPLTARFNAYNLLACYAGCILSGFEEAEVLRALSVARPAEGRLELIRSHSRHITGIIDYAHTPDALAKLLESIQQLTNVGKVITVFGCGGDRDRDKRPKMGHIASLLSDIVILTSDNPRTEDPDRILRQIAAGIPQDTKAKLLTIEQRKEAIKTAWMLASEGDVIVLAGKGHEKYQIIGDTKTPFDDKEILETLMKESDKKIE